MGGNALKNVVTRRYTRTEYYLLKERILNIIRPFLEEYDVPKEFPSKESFGDLDVLMVCPASIRCRRLITDLFHPTEIVENGDVYSFDVEQFQIDFIVVPQEQFHNAIVYFSYSDLGGLIGNICHKIGLKYGIQGLWMNIHTKEFDPTTTSTKLILSQNAEQIFHFLGHDYQQYLRGFNDEREFFQWITEGKYFRRLYFANDQLNHAHRQRTSKRPIYIQFIDYLNKQQITSEQINESHQNEQRQLTLIVRQQALIDFNKQEEYQQRLNARDHKRKVREKYSGQFFCDIAETKPMIRVHMQQFQRRFGQTDAEFDEWLRNTDQQTIQIEIDRYKKELRNDTSS